MCVVIRRPMEVLDPEDVAALLDQLRPILEALEGRANVNKSQQLGGWMGATVTAHPEAVQRALNAPRLTIGDLASRPGIPRETLASYITGNRRAPAPIAHRLAIVLRQHAEELAALAAELDELT